VQQILAQAAHGSQSEEAEPLLIELRREFDDDGEIASGKNGAAAGVESFYTRSAYIAGQPLDDSYHFGQTIINDYGRPYGRGFNHLTGLSTRGKVGPLGFYVRGEYQHAPGSDTYPLSVRQVIAKADANPLQPPFAVAQRDQFRLLDSYVAVNSLGQEFSLGKQSLWWGPGEGGAMLMSNNAEPFYMFRINRTEPLSIPGFSRLFGPIRWDNYFGRLAGHQFPHAPFTYGNKISLKPTPNLEFGFSRSAVFAGQGLTPLTFYTFLHSFFSGTSSTNPGFDIRRSAGARHGAFDFSYRLPWLRDWVTLYSDSVVHDDVSPIDAPRRAAINPGIYISHFPELAKLDLRAEAVNTDPPVSRSVGGRFIYWESFYHDAYTNKGNLLGSWIGREGKGGQLWTTYRFSPVSSVQLGYRHAKIAKDFIPQGETANDISVKTTVRLRSDLELQTLVQYEAWFSPVLAPARQSDVLGTVQLTCWPQHLFKKGPRE
jgi:hypothetical protein